LPLSLFWSVSVEEIQPPSSVPKHVDRYLFASFGHRFNKFTFILTQTLSPSLFWKRLTKCIFVFAGLLPTLVFLVRGDVCGRKLLSRCSPGSRTDRRKVRVIRSPDLSVQETPRWFESYDSSLQFMCERILGGMLKLYIQF